MKRITNKGKGIFSIIIALCLIVNIFMPTAVLAKDLSTADNSITISVERRVLGESNILDPIKVEITPDEKASVVIDRVFKERNIEYKNTGSIEDSLYISGIKDGNGEWLSESAHGFLSGWKYSVNDEFPGVGFSGYYLKAGDKLRVQYTAKDFGQDILAVEKVFAVREKLVESEKISKDKYTEESFNILQDEISNIKPKLPSNVQIGEMMSDVLGDGSCDTYAYESEMDKLLKSLEKAVAALEEKVEAPTIEPEFNIDIFNNWDHVDFETTDQPNTAYLQEGEKSIGAKVVRLTEDNKPVMFNGVELPIVNGSAIIELVPGIHTLSITRWGKPYEISIPCRRAPYTIEGELTPGGTVTIDFKDQVEEGLKNTSRYKLEQTTLEYASNIPGLKKVTSETLIGGTVDREKLSKVTFTIPKDTEVGEYELTKGCIDQKWGYTSYGNDAFKGKFSVLPNIKIIVNSKIDLSKAYDIDLSKWSEFDKVYSLEDTILLKLKDVNAVSKVLVNGETVNPIENIYAVELPLGENKITVDGKEYKVFVKKVTYTISNENSIIPGSEVNLIFNGLEEAFVYIPSKYNPSTIKTVYSTNMQGLDKIESEKAGSYTSIDREKLNTIKFTIPKDAKAGTYAITDGGIYQEWWGNSIIGSTYKEGAYKKNFSILPRVDFKVRDSISEDKEAPEIVTDLINNKIVSKEKLKFKVIINDNVDTTVVPGVKLNDEILEGSNSGEYNVVLNEGENKIEIEAIDATGNKTNKVYIVNYKVKLREGASIILDTIDLVLNKEETHQIIAVDAHDYRTNEDEDTAKMTYKVIKGNEVAKVSKLGVVTAIEPGFAEISVRYAGLETPAILNVHVKGENEASGPRVTTSIKETKYDVLYFSGEAYDYHFSVNAEDSDVVVMFNDTEVSKDSKDNYNVKLTEGYNLIKVRATKGSQITYQTYNLRAKKAYVNVENLTNPGQDIFQGDEVSISLKGVETPVPKFLRVYNPKRTRVEYKTDIPGVTNIFGNATQYNIATDNAIKFIATTAGTFNFTGGNIEEAWWGDELFKERDISGEGPNTSASVRQGNFSKLPEVKLEVKENKEYKNKYTAEILNKEPIKAGDEVALVINNLDMPNTGSGRVIRANTIFNTDINGLDEIISEDAVEDVSKLQSIKFTIPKGTKEGTYTITNGRVFKEWQKSSLYADAEFYKGELPVIKIEVTEEKVEVVNPSMTIEEGIKESIKWTLDNMENPSLGSEWYMLGLTRTDYYSDKDYVDKYYENLVKVLKENNGELTENKYTEYSRTIIALTAIGKDPTNAGGYNLVEKLYNFSKVSRQGINGVIFALIALDTKNFEIPEDANNSREKMINYILNAQLKDGGFALRGEKGNVDITAMALQALSKYKDEEKVGESIEKALEFLSNVQLENGGFESEGVENLESAAQTLVALTSLGIDPKDSRFVKNGNWVVSAIMKFADENGGFKHVLEEDTANPMATEQALYSLISYERFLKGKTGLYDMTDVEIDNDNEEPKPDADGDKPDTDKPNVDDDKPDAGGDKPNANGDKPNADGNKPNADGNKPNADGNKPSPGTNNTDKVQTGDDNSLAINLILMVASISVIGLVLRKKVLVKESNNR